MVRRLEGGCLVGTWQDAAAIRHGSLAITPCVGRATGAGAMSLRFLAASAGASPSWSSAGADEVLYVLDGRGTLRLDGADHEIERQTGIYVAPGTCASLVNPGPEPLILASAICPDPGAPPEMAPPPPPGARPGALSAASPHPLVRLSDRPAVPTGDRWYRVLIDQEAGCREVTQFVGSIPPGRAPDHFHQYEEVLVILSGSGVMHAGATSAPLAPGSWVFLPRTQVHCVENTERGELRLLGVFYPAGSPATRYDA